MEEQEEVLNEAKYQKTKRKISIIALLIFIVGISIGGFLIGTGIRKQKEVKTQNLAKNESIYSIEEEIDNLNSDLATLKAKKNAEFNNNGMSEEFYKLDNEINRIQKRVMNLESDSWNAKHGTKTMPEKYIPYYIFGGFVIFLSLALSGNIYLISKGREILAYTAQQTIPVAQEGIEKMAPSIGKAGDEIVKKVAPAFGEIAKEVAKGIKEGSDTDKTE